MTARLIISDDACVLQQFSDAAWNRAALLPDGASALQPNQANML